ITGPMGPRKLDPVPTAGSAVKPSIIIVIIIVAVVRVIGSLVQIYLIRQRRRAPHIGAVIWIGRVTVSRNNTSRKKDWAADNHKQSE
ncbi:MAG: hypothetical protein PHI97_35565, partial [Desulfobulbus sp.]|nr:hypothetical protein [Desulfobulbus sp.]